jgi:membrane protease YdiL (CAAX protease family)
VPVSQVSNAVSSASVLLFAHFVLQILIVSVGEELGWRGWLLPRLLESHTRLVATLLTATAWSFWHGPLLLSSPLTTALFLAATLGLSFQFTWIWAHSGQRLFLVVLAHATVNTPIFFWEKLSASGSYPAAALSAWTVLQVVYAVAGCGLVLVTRPWWLQRQRGEPSTPVRI